MKAPQTTLRTLGLSAIIALAGTSLSATTLVLNPTGDGYIRASQSAGTATGKTQSTTNQIFLVGDTTTADDFLRGVLAFDLSDSALVGATINSVTLKLVVASTDTGTSENVSVTLNAHKLTSSFEEASVSWFDRATGNAWTTPGGDFGSALASASANAATVSANDNISFSAPGLTSGATDSVGGSLYLLIKLATEDTAARNIFRFGTSEATSTFLPTLTIDYTASIPEPSAFAALGGLAVIGFAGARRRR